MLIAGGGIGGLAAALACVRAGWRARVFESAPAFAEVGAGLQLGPNATRILHRWDLGPALAELAAFPERLEVRSAASGRTLGRLRLGADTWRRYGAPYATLHRADLHGLLHAAVQAQGETALHLGSRIGALRQRADVVALAVRRDEQPQATEVEGDALLGADGLWSGVRAQLLPGDPPPRVTGQFAYRALLRQPALPAALRSSQVTVWLGTGLHAVQYPVRGGEWLNFVVLVEESEPGAATDPRGWDLDAPPEGPRAALQGACAPLRALCEAVPHWRRWRLCDRPPVAAPETLAAGRVALIGDAAHPMLPYLAQGAGMAIEDAAEIGHVLAMDAVDVPLRLRRYALQRWQRVARVQARSTRNARVFHASGALRWGRDAAMAVLGERLLDMPWLYAGQ
ncbi:FAD-dependent monooxygenase [Xylophilus sp. ASV27]|uniref:FAD-dependent monooxygenase n=1 Tax=Xylophilus sp. ASV27 TaxID=2795129 RepID=UPI0018EC5986|nr:FAD-dependent monooxygenase [Xylophilus sp. ASV27]